ncbi:phosphoglycerate kinase [Candidatus Kaiserbacteria bacterium RIFCSPHIGHO2_02_FULL_50_50]|uniref:Phosphoglycerate kinase n=1 Tax=Candidatus Kaiserbacteria bacterium RIFCSPHIGHO2_02_FULL_50_50 TaxID=1798492 RepID=A0A1F6DBW1_9BACT|nr:MAG: phosphoglycerate kinase [Candidatus Kaiserbacteria bacterium RIFCSPHIGHO2_02_FULL_50_50]OGG88539.1 MAG: phosphoglycerate kinase [Candidatus Kaiserbacteria bacterium RIFCSPLOWO2_12_FULL_50_10]
MKTLPTIDALPDVQGKRVLVRASLNVPLLHGNVSDETRLRANLPTIKVLQERGAKIILLGHLGREGESLRVVADALAKYVPVTFINTAYDAPETMQGIDALSDGEIVMLENVRRDEREEKNDPQYAASMAALADYFVIDAFADAHREHASVTGIAKILPTVFGLSFMQEYNALLLVVEPKSPSLAIIGGAKFDTKTPLIKALAKKYTHVFIGGALINDVYKARGYEIGKSVASLGAIDPEILALPNLVVPFDVRIQEASGEVVQDDATEILPDAMVVDIGQRSFAELAEYIDTAVTIVWNGPLGYYEGGFDTFTKECAKRIAANTHATTIVGGGDTLAAIEETGTAAAFTHLSTAGGAMLTFLETGTLPVIDLVTEDLA